MCKDVIELRNVAFGLIVGECGLCAYGRGACGELVRKARLGVGIVMLPYLTCLEERKKERKKERNE
jgi:hypothetical protein